MDFSFVKLITPDNIAVAIGAASAAITATFFIMRRLHNIRVEALEKNLKDERQKLAILQEENRKRIDEIIARHETEIDRMRERYDRDMRLMQERILRLETRWENTVIQKQNVEKI